jgi:hypothetical protein
MPVSNPIIHVAPGSGDMPRAIRTPGSPGTTSSTGTGTTSPTSGQIWPR